MAPNTVKTTYSHGVAPFAAPIARRGASSRTTCPTNPTRSLAPSRSANYSGVGRWSRRGNWNASATSWSIATNWARRTRTISPNLPKRCWSSSHRSSTAAGTPRWRPIPQVAGRGPHARKRRLSPQGGSRQQGGSRLHGGSPLPRGSRRPVRSHRTGERGAPPDGRTF